MRIFGRETQIRMKKTLTLFITSVLFISCLRNNQPKCSDESVKAVLKEIIAQSAYQDTTSFKMLISNIRTISRNKEFNSCECEAILKLPEYPLVGGNIKYTAQLTDDGKTVSVEIHK